MKNNSKDTVVIVAASAKSDLWHRRLGHMSEKGMKVFLSKGKLPLKIVELNLCESCIFRKQKSVSFSKADKDLKAI